MTNTTQNDLPLLRAFNLEAAKAGEEIQWSMLDDKVKFIGLSSAGLLVYESCDELGVTDADSFRMKPLCWVENRPVYNGDVLFNLLGVPRTAVYIKENFLCGEALYCEDGFWNDPDDLTWNKPKQKVKRKVWLNVYPEDYTTGYASKEVADNMASPTRITCIETEIEYEV